MNLDEALKQFDIVEANLSKLDGLWQRIRSLIPQDVAFTAASPEGREYRQLCRDYQRLLTGLPSIDGWAVLAYPLDPGDIERRRINAAEIDEIEILASLERDVNAPGAQIDEYRSRFMVKRRELLRARSSELMGEVDSTVEVLRNASSPEDYPDSWAQLCRLVGEIERLLGSKSRSRAWSNLRRHLSFAMECDLHDIIEHDWPAVKVELQELGYDTTDPLPVAVGDLGSLAATRPAGSVSTSLAWSALDDEGFERLVFLLLSDAPGYENPEWLTKTNAPDRGRDLAVWRVREDSLAGTVREKAIVQCKHWLSKSIPDTELSAAVTKMAHWEPPPVDTLVVVTSGRFTADAVQWAERHNSSGKRPRIELWPENRLERALAQRPSIAVSFGLR